MVMGMEMCGTSLMQSSSDITTTDGFEGLGLFYIIGQLFMRGLQMAIVPLVLTSLSLAM